MIRYPKVLLINIYILAACRSVSTPPSEPIPLPSTPAIPGVTANAQAIHHWLIPLTTGTHRYASTSRTIIQDTGNHAIRRDTVQASIWFTISGNNHTDSILLRGSIDSIRSKTSLPTIQRTVPFTVSIKSGQIRFQTESPGTPNYSCSNSVTESLGDIAAILITRPTNLSTSSTWTDTSTTTTCSGGFPISSERVRSYRVLGEETQNGALILKLHRFETSIFSGSGAQGQHQVSIKGESQTTSQVLIDIESGIPTNSTTKETASIFITSSGQINQFTQQVDQTVTLIR